MKRYSLFLLVALALAGCDDDPARPAGSTDPETTLQLTGTEPFGVTFEWSGSIANGTIAGFWVGWDDLLRFTTESGGTFHAPPAFGEHTFSCIAQDEEGRIDPTPARLTLSVPDVYMDSPNDVVDALVFAYQRRDPGLHVLLANDPERNSEFLFILSEPTEGGETQWGFETEARIHRRMFDPENVPPGETQVPLDLWLESVSINLSQQASFAERTDLYSSDGGADGLLDPSIWRAFGATYSTDVFFAMAGELDYQVNGLADFVVIEDLTKNVGEPGRFLLFIWEDLGSPAFRNANASALQQETWSGIKGVYR